MSFFDSTKGRSGHGLSGRTASELLTLPVCHQGIELGRAVDVLLDLRGGRALGFEVHCGDDARRFLPLGAARIGRKAVETGSSLTLLDDLAFYANRSTSLRSVRGTRVERGGRSTGVLVDVVMSDTGSIASLLVDSGVGLRRVPFDGGVKLGPERRVSAA
jgi:uncharacterized protein YrrD